MSQGQESGARAAKYGLLTAKKIAEKLGGKKIGNARSNEYEIDNKKVVIKCAKVKTNNIGVEYHMLDRISAILGAFETEDGTYNIYEIKPDIFRESMRPTKSKGASAGRVGMVRKLVFSDRGKFVMNLPIDES